MKNKRILALALIIASVFALCLPASAEEDIVFTVQPQGGTVNTGQDFVFTWESTGDCRYMLQMRSDETDGWGNVDWITSPCTIGEYSFEFTSQYRVLAERRSDGECFPSDVFTVSWVLPEDLTDAEMDDVFFDDLPLGFDEAPIMKITFRNVGKNDLRNPRIEMGYGGEAIFEILECDIPDDTPAGCTDSVTWGIRPKKGLGLGYYNELFYLSADNLDGSVCAAAVLTVVESDVEIVFEAEANDVDFGFLRAGYQDPGTVDLVVRASGTGNLSNVRVRVAEEQNFFTLYENFALIGSLPAGTDSRTNWYVRLNTGLEPGEYSAKILIYADELDTPAAATVRVKVFGEDESIPEQVSETDVSGEPGERSSGKNRDNRDPGAGFPWLAVVIPVSVLAVAAVVFVIIKRKNK